MFDELSKIPTPTVNADGSVTWDLGYGIKHTVSAENYAALQRGLKLAEQGGPKFLASIRRRTIPQLKALCVEAGRSTRGFTYKQEYLDALSGWYTQFCLQQAGYVDSRR